MPWSNAYGLVDSRQRYPSIMFQHSYLKDDCPIAESTVVTLGVIAWIVHCHHFSFATTQLHIDLLWPVPFSPFCVNHREMCLHGNPCVCKVIHVLLQKCMCLFRNSEHECKYDGGRVGSPESFLVFEFNQFFQTQQRSGLVDWLTIVARWRSAYSRDVIMHRSPWRPDPINICRGAHGNPYLVYDWEMLSFLKNVFTMPKWFAKCHWQKP